MFYRHSLREKCGQKCENVWRNRLLIIKRLENAVSLENRTFVSKNDTITGIDEDGSNLFVK